MIDAFNHGVKIQGFRGVLAGFVHGNNGFFSEINSEPQFCP
jgi:hypothetical protein